jgi:hypothetical protein
MSKVDELAQLHDLFVRGAVTSEEFAAMKAKIIAEPPVRGVNDKLDNIQQATASATGKYIFYIIGAACIGWIVTGLVEAVIGFRAYELEKSRALAVGLIVVYVLPTGLVALFLIRRKRNVRVGVCVLVGDTILLAAAALLFHVGD